MSTKGRRSQQVPPKAGRPGEYYTDFVARVLVGLEPGCSVQTGEWTEGPDGRRDMDVEVRGSKEGNPYFSLVECKDWKRRVGIQVVDALESKRRDLRADRAIIYSNSGFTRLALRKGRRTGVELAAAICKHDPKIRPHLVAPIVANHYFPTERTLRLMVVGQPHPPVPFDLGDIFYKGLPLQNWVSEQAPKVIRPNGNAPSIEVRYLFGTPIGLLVRGQEVSVAGVHLVLKYRRELVFQNVPVELSIGALDVSGSKVLIPPGQSIEWTFRKDKWEPVPERSPLRTKVRRGGGISFDMTLVSTIPDHQMTGMPDLDAVINSCSVVSRTDADSTRR